MSRIHEALKKAEQERLAGWNAPAAPATEAETVSSVPAPDHKPAGVKAAVSSPPEPAAPSAADSLLTNCQRSRWNLEPKMALLFNASHSAGSEELRTLRSRLYQIRERQPLHSVLITSALPGEGKTFLTANLASMIVRQHERRALIIDADLRRSQLHLALGAPGAPGLTDYLRGDADEASIMQRGPHDNLFLIPGGKPVSNPAELLANGSLKTLLDRLVPLFDWILIDSPPAVPVSDATMLADLCDGVLLVVQSASTPYDLAQRTRDQFQEKRLLGVVLNRLSASETYHSYYYSHYHGAEKK